MRITEITGAFQAICAGIAVILSIVTINIASKSFDRGAIPEKALSYFTLGASDALKDLKSGGQDIKFSVNARGKDLKNLYIITSTLRNNGHAPILPEDIYDNIRVSTDAPWKIITVSNNSTGGQNIAFDWIRVSDAEFKAAKSLINPNDYIQLTVYMTRSDNEDADTEPQLKWSARISNLSQLGEQKTDLIALQKPALLPLFIYTNGNGILFIISCFAFYLFSFLYFIQSVYGVVAGSVKSIYTIVGVAVLSLCGAEAGNAYVFGSNIITNAPVLHWVNAPWLIVTWSSLGILIYRYLKRGRPAPASE